MNNIQIKNIVEKIENTLCYLYNYAQYVNLPNKIAKEKRENSIVFK